METKQSVYNILAAKSVKVELGASGSTRLAITIPFSCLRFGNSKKYFYCIGNVVFKII